MGEIRSTLDIIMEKTKDLNLTADEKRELREKGIKTKTRGLLQRYLDGVVSLGKFKAEFGALSSGGEASAGNMLLREIIDRLAPEKDNAPLLQALQGVLGIDAAPWRQVINEFQRELEEEKAAQEKRLQQKLLKRGIFGTSVVPNLRREHAWSEYLAAMQGRLQNKLRSLVQSV